MAANTSICEVNCIAVYFANTHVGRGAFARKSTQYRLRISPNVCIYAITRYSNITNNFCTLFTVNQLAENTRQYISSGNTTYRSGKLSGGLTIPSRSLLLRLRWYSGKATRHCCVSAALMHIRQRPPHHPHPPFYLQYRWPKLRYSTFLSQRLNERPSLSGLYYQLSPQ